MGKTTVSTSPISDENGLRARPKQLDPRGWPLFPKLAIAMILGILVTALGLTLLSMQRERQTFQQELDRNEQELKGLENQLNALIEQFEGQQSGMNASTRQQRVERIRELQNQLQARAQELEEQSYDRETALLGPLQTRVQEAIDAIRVQRGLSAILDVTAEGSGLVSVDPTLDLTQEVIQRVRR